MIQPLTPTMTFAIKSIQPGGPWAGYGHGFFLTDQDSHGCFIETLDRVRCRRDIVGGWSYLHGIQILDGTIDNYQVMIEDWDGITTTHSYDDLPGALQRLLPRPVTPLGQQEEANHA